MKDRPVFNVARATDGIFAVFDVLRELDLTYAEAIHAVRCVASVLEAQMTPDALALLDSLTSRDSSTPIR